MLLEQLPRISEVVVTELKSQAADASRDARVHLGCTNEPVVTRKKRVVRATRDHVAPGIRTGQAHSSGGCVRPVLAKLDHVSAVDKVQELLRASRFNSGRAREVAAACKFPLNHLDYWLVGMAKADGSISHAPFDVLVAICIPHMAAGTTGDEPGGKHRVLVIAFGIGMAAARDQVMGKALQPSGCIEAKSWGAHIRFLRWYSGWGGRDVSAFAGYISSHSLLGTSPGNLLRSMSVLSSAKRLMESPSWAAFTKAAARVLFQAGNPRFLAQYRFNRESESQ
jgi:hypothetical protein